ncbi:putative outer membrane protein [Streptoalloteichus tenebrarius]|uniref:Outer membrane protein n=1 Tax=Streptoalloteichus tenebrarius (strain ATCC 17920 / DSM 40477 / JCM 4838 / CBS 697.72 / NBRC 16177 / NCIMB 11028 / NRRL B-12390 / A12253. 1 / ISP 5477) TaxID=1933 RepID=A0ABT1HSM6_STRSD|nr:DUF4142 domain-containing protein [Streptoalloteichus tenebrarius]MCP2258501.1 putative outer membrane protein [Streptoalloteichus tenebrarius]
MLTVPRLGRLISAVALALAASAGAVGAAGVAHAEQTVSDQDRQFLEQAHQANLAEIDAGRLARSRGSRQLVRDLGARFEEDHTRLDEALTQTASALGVALPDTPDPDQKAVHERLQNASDEEFDALFVRTQTEGHAKVMRLGETELAQGSSAEVKKVASDAAPVVKSHHDALLAAAGEVGAPTMINAGSAGLASTSAWQGPGVVLLATGLLLVVAGFVLRRGFARRDRVVR